MNTSYTNKDRKRQEAKARNEVWRALPFNVKIAILKQRPGLSKRQLTRLTQVNTVNKSHV